MDYKKRREKVFKVIEERGLDGAIFISPENVFYFTGAPFVKGSVGKILYFAKDGTASIIVTDLDYQEVVDFVDTDALKIVKTEFGERPSERLKKISGKKVGFEEQHLSYYLYDYLRKDLELQPLNGVAEKMREVKDEGEIRRIEEAQKITERALDEALQSFVKGMTEVEVASEVERRMRLLGAESYAFESIVASGERAVYPHGKPTKKRIEEGESVILDLGAQVGGYCSDMTRTFFVGTPRRVLRDVYDAVVQAQNEALKAAREGITGKELDGVARSILKEFGYDQYFGHGLGHGVGIDVHEGPSVSPRGEAKLTTGNVVTIEPGVYIPRMGGVRIEDMVVITGGGSRNLTNFSKKFIEI
ncbi:MAG: Xaa-Pro peptidase family protein [Candidatus Methanomethylicaceae archaeon]|nr:Xaa-Pro peptidase family protein [Candidatus Verstraetearchaeota archaeon]